MKYIKARPVSYGSKRDKKNVLYIVIHYTGVKKDTAVGEASYFAHGNNRSAGAHFFVDRTGTVVKSIPMNLTAWSVGGVYDLKSPAGKYYGKCTNYNSVSIELCDNSTKKPSEKQIEAVKKTIKHIQKYCKNAKTIIRHYDVNGKCCPARMCGTPTGEENWESFKQAIV